MSPIILFFSERTSGVYILLESLQYFIHILDIPIDLSTVWEIDTRLEDVK